MKYVKLFVGFLSAGIAFILAGFYFRTLVVGSRSCPATPIPSNISLMLQSCYVFWTGTLLIWVGVALLITALGIGLYGHFKSKRNVPPANTSKLEPQAAQVNP